MTNKLTAKEIKAIIEEKGDNLLELTVQVPMNTFLLPLETQKQVVARTVGSEKFKTTSFAFAGSVPNSQIAEVKATIEIDTEVLEELVAAEIAFEAQFEGYEFIVNPQPLEVVKSWSELEVKPIVFSIPSYQLSNINPMAKAVAISKLISKDITLPAFEFVAVGVDPKDTTHMLVKANLKVDPSYIEAFENQETATNQLYAVLSAEGATRISKPYTESEIEEMADEDGEVRIDVLIEMEYSDLMDAANENDEIEAIEELITEEYNIEDLEHTAVGFNSITNKLIIRATCSIYVD